MWHETEGGEFVTSARNAQHRSSGLGRNNSKTRIFGMCHGFHVYKCLHFVLIVPAKACFFLFLSSSLIP